MGISNLLSVKVLVLIQLTSAPVSNKLFTDNWPILEVAYGRRVSDLIALTLGIKEFIVFKAIFL